MLNPLHRVCTRSHSMSSAAWLLPCGAQESGWPIGRDHPTQDREQAPIGPLAMRLLDLVRRQTMPQPWSEGEKIPWDDPGFSERMLDEHLSQEHGRASRAVKTIEQHVEWVHRELLGGSPSRVLDLGCGPGLYTNRLAALGHECVGIDFSPASIAYARAQAKASRLACRYTLEDIRSANYGEGFDLVMLIFGELNVFTRADAKSILERARRALSSTGALLLEPHTFAAVRATGERPSTWYSGERGLFSADPHLCLVENFWHPQQRAATERYFVVDAGSAGVTRYASSMQGYTNDEYRALLSASDFAAIEFHAGMGDDRDDSQSGLLVITARTPG